MLNKEYLNLMPQQRLKEDVNAREEESIFIIGHLFKKWYGKETKFTSSDLSSLLNKFQLADTDDEREYPRLWILDHWPDELSGKYTVFDDRWNGWMDSSYTTPTGESVETESKRVVSSKNERKASKSNVKKSKRGKQSTKNGNNTKTKNNNKS